MSPWDGFSGGLILVVSVFRKGLNNFPPDEATPEGQTISVSPASQSLMLSCKTCPLPLLWGALGVGCLPPELPLKAGGPRLPGSSWGSATSSLPSPVTAASTASGSLRSPLCPAEGLLPPLRHQRCRQGSRGPSGRPSPGRRGRCPAPGCSWLCSSGSGGF